ncbi:MAG: phosphatidate cytidylyltransferase [Hyphomicrobium sp.]|nr:phosphatidate cytidylyltransferase [Hyphomicrobium sp.]
MPDNVVASQTEAGNAPWLSSNLKLRLISGAVLATVAFLLTYAGPLPFALLILVCALVISWEWGRLVRGATFDLGFFLHAIGVTAAIVLAAAGYAALALAVLVITAITLVPLYIGRGARLSGLGVFYVGLPAVALLWLRSDEPFGFTAVLFVFAVVWASDTAAYAAGRSIGGPKLWPRVSPNKTWAGLAGALTAGAVAAAVFAVLEPEVGPLRLILLGVALALVAQAGDLAESALKRLFNLKDASDLIPGHGGFMDRMDSIVAAAVAAALLALAIDPHAPARALLFGI